MPPVLATSHIVEKFSRPGFKPAGGIKINLELLVADLARKLRYGLLDKHSVNLEDDLRGAIKMHEVNEENWHPEKREC